MPKNKFKTRLLPIADKDLSDIISYIAAENVTAAEKLLDRISASLENLSHFPFLGRRPRDEALASKSYRYLLLENYLIFYTIDEPEKLC